MPTETLSIGCGDNKRDSDAVGVDVRQYGDVDVVHDITETPWPFESGRFSQINAFSILEHVPNLPEVMAEIHRVGRDGAVLRGKVPHWKDRNAYVDPTHVATEQATLPDGGTVTLPPSGDHPESSDLTPMGTMVCGFDEQTFDFWDSTTELGQRGYFDPEFRVREAERIRRIQFWKSRPLTFELEVVK